MVIRIKVTLEKEEYSALLKLALSELRSPDEQLRFTLIQHLKHLNLLSEKSDQIQRAVKGPKPNSTSKDNQENYEHTITKS